MSTIDPADQQRERRRRRVGDPRILVAFIASAALMAVGAFLFGLAIATTADMLRHVLIDSTFDDRIPFPMFWGAGTIGYLWMLGSIGAIGGSGFAVWLLDMYRGGEQQPRILAALGTCAAAAAVVLNAPTWLEPLAVGIKLDPVFHEDDPWSVVGWIAYYADVWLPTLVVIIAGLVVTHAIRHYGRLRRQLAARDRLLAEGRRTTGAITAATLRTSVNDQGQRSIVGTDVMVKFTDDQGVDRWVARFNRDRTAILGSGFVAVLFDPRRPGDDDLIFVAFHRDPMPAEWIGRTI